MQSRKFFLRVIIGCVHGTSFEIQCPTLVILISSPFSKDVCLVIINSENLKHFGMKWLKSWILKKTDGLMNCMRKGKCGQQAISEEISM